MRRCTKFQQKKQQSAAELLTIRQMSKCHRDTHAHTHTEPERDGKRESALETKRPGCSAECRDPRLKHAFEEHSGILSGDGEIENGQRSDSVHKQTGNDSYHVQTKLLRGSTQILDVQNLARDETHDSKR